MKTPLVAAYAMLLGLIPIAACSDQGGGNLGRNAPDLFTVKKEPLRISVEEEGEMRAYRETKVRSEVEGSATVIYLVPEGKVVEKGEKLVELDASDLQERQANQEISLERARAAKVQAEQNLEIQMKEIRASKETARSSLTIAQMEYEKFLGGDAVAQLSIERGTNQEMLTKLRDLVSENPELGPLYDKVRSDLLSATDVKRDMGQMAQDILTAIDAVRLSVADLKIKADRLEHSKRLRIKEYITRTELEGDQYQRDSSFSKVTLEKTKLDLLINYTLKTTQIQLRQDVANAELELAKVIAQNKARQTREEADFNAKTAEYDLAKERFENLKLQIANSVIFSPTPGLVVYATQGDGRRGRETVEEGIEVRERQNLIVLPDVSRMVCDIKVQEADIDKVLVGQRATISVDAFPGELFAGVVNFVSSLPDSGNRWSNSDKKVYKASILIDGENELLRPGISAKVEVIIREVEDALIVPKQAVRRSGKTQYVWLASPDGPKATAVTLGQSNLSHVQVIQPLHEGQRVHLAPPPGFTEPKFEDQQEPSNSDSTPQQTKPSTPAPTTRDEPARSASTGSDPSAKLEQFRRKLAQALPDREDLKEPRGWFRALQDPEVRATIAADPELKALSDAMRQSSGSQKQRTPNQEPGAR